MMFGTKLFFPFVILCLLSSEIFGIQTILKHQQQGQSNVNSFQLDSGKQLEKPLTVKTNDTLSIELSKFEKDFEHTFVIAKPKKPNFPTLRFPSSHKHNKHSSSIQFDLKTNRFLGGNGLYHLYITFLRNSEAPFNVDIGKINWDLIQSPHDLKALNPPLEFEYPEEEKIGNPFLSWIFTLAVLFPWFLLLPSWLHVASQMEHKWFFSTLSLMLCVFGFAGLGYMFWVRWNLLQILPYFIGLIALSVPVTRVALRRVNQWKRA